MKKQFCVLLCTLLLLGLCGCSAPTGTAGKAAAAPNYPKSIGYEDFDARRQNRQANAVEDRTLESVNHFAVSLSSALLDHGENGCCSPVSLYYALALAAAGADGETRQELLDVLGMDSVRTLADQCGKLYRLLYADNEVSQLRIANSLWLGSDFEGGTVSFREDYLDTASEQFYASLHPADFGTADTDSAMSRWVSDQTEGLLEPRFESSGEQIMAILNTVYFYDEWISAFREENTAERSFRLADGGTVSADFMNSGSLGGFFRGGNFTRAGLGLKNGGSMQFILPDEGVALSALMADPEALREALLGGEERYGEIAWSIPKFSCGSQYTPTDTLQQLGVVSAFDPERADFSGITDQSCWISRINHGTHISIDEKGVEAAAYTELAFAGAGMPEDRADMILDRPFLYAVTDSQGCLLFVGVCADPTAE